LTALARTILFLSAYSPAFLLLAWRAIPTNPALSVGLATFSGLIVLLTWRLVRELRHGTPLRAVVVQAESRSQDVAGFLLAYVLPFIVVDYRDISTVAVLAVVFVLLGIVTVRGHLSHLNPLLLLAGLNVWSLRINYRETSMPAADAKLDAVAPSVTVISDDLDLSKGSVLWISKADGPIWFAAKRDPNA
jgi:hypothetical protein